VRLCRDVTKERLIVTALNAALAGRSAAPSLAPSYWGDGINDHLIKSNLWCPRRRSARGRVEMWRGGCRPNISVAAPHMGVIRSKGFVPSFSPFVSDPKSEPSVIRPGLPVLVSTSHTVAARRRSYQYPAYGRAGAQEDETNLSFGLSRPEGRGGRPLGSAGTDQSQ